MNIRNLMKILLVLLFSGFISPVYSATIKWSMPGDSLTLDPHAQNEGPTHMVARQVYESLVTRGIDMSIEPQLSDSWSTTDPETWVFKLRGGVKLVKSISPDNNAATLVASLLIGNNSILSIIC